MKKLTFICIVILSFLILGWNVQAKDIELILYKHFLQNVMEKVFPVRLTKNFSLGIPLEGIGEQLSFNYKIAIRDPKLTIFDKYIKVDATVDCMTDFGKQTFPGVCKFIPVFDDVSNRIKLKVIEGNIKVKINLPSTIIDIGKLDISQSISNITIPLEYGKVHISGKSLKPRCSNVSIKLYQDKIVVEGDIQMI